jgi:hypothetical protein
MLRYIAAFLLPSFAYSQLQTSDSLSLFAPGVVSTFLYERDLAMSIDGNEIYYTIQVPETRFSTIVTSKKKNGKWSTPSVAPFSGKFSDLEPAFSPDGNTLYFVSNRSLNADSLKDYDIWFVIRTAEGWSAPKNIGAPVNTVHDEFYPSITSKGNIYFTAEYKSGVGREDIFVATKTDSGFSQPQPLDTSINSKFYEFNAFVSADDRYILFSSFGRPDDKGRGDLYISERDSNGQWKPAINLAFLNTNRLDYCPSLSSGNKLLFITREGLDLPAASAQKTYSYDQLKRSHNSILNGRGNIYAIPFDVVLKKLAEQKR